MSKKEQGNRPKLSDTLEEAAETFNSEDAARMWDYEGKTQGEIVEAAFKAGAEWQKEQMMKEAVEGTVHNFSSYKPHPTVLVDAKGFNQGDKVRIIIVKEEWK